ncbi:DUF1289 domain-containing protein [Pseudomonas hunanensis]|uniref:Fe-S protein YdhL (DUF1289 family) n=1 Tax=Pseudomonas hunanensis TaxID=1247546 RepID=A0ACC6K5Q0_9PSED|nr:DUF1289 domain-containing protein [Pseudomonas hunanensis]MBP2261855.1 putative Fe-S protein YdhL (DUF1289 family) [Pseudomonas sp. BP8]MDR6713740.1 putative Fe-S protein YdhL (DUF1289 family) [Pseudomonas hunanensis]HDS1737299.1 DUF1289 domain-containing protein [Pseudomonas putida]
MAKDADNPCTSNCKIRDEICVGCGRSKDDIRKWKRMKKSERIEVVHKAKARLKALKKRK